MLAFLVINTLLHSLAALAATFSAVAFYRYLLIMQSHLQSEFWVNFEFWIRPRLGGLPHREAFTWQKIWPRLRGLPGLADRATRLGGSPYWLCKRNQIKTRDYMDRRVTPPTWGPPSPCKQVLKVRIKCTLSALVSPSVNWPTKPTSV